MLIKIQVKLATYIELLSTLKINKRNDFNIKSDIDDNLSFEAYRKKFMSVMEYLKEGDCYQINLSKQYKVLVEEIVGNFIRSLEI